MDRGVKPVYVREKSIASSGGGSEDQLSPPSDSSRGGVNIMMHRHSRSGSIGKKSHNTKAAAQRLARMMSHQQTNDTEDDDDDELLSDYNPNTTTPGRSQIGCRSPMKVRTTTTEQSSVSHASRASQIVINHAEKTQSHQIQTSSSIRSSSPSKTIVEHVQPTSARANRSPQLFNPKEQPSSARAVSACRPSSTSLMKPVTMVPPTVSLSLRPSSFKDQGNNQTQNDKRLSLDFGAFTFRESSIQRSASASTPVSVSASASTCAMEDEIDMLQEENESLLKKLRIAEEKCEEAEVRARQLEKQVAHLGEGVSLEAKLLNRKEAALQQREAALKVAATQTTTNNSAIRGGVIEALRSEVETARDEAALVTDQLHETEFEVRSLKTMTQRMVLTQEEMEEVVLKRCWLSRYWSLCVQHGIHPEIAGARYEYWSSFAPLPVEVVIAAGQKAKHEKLMVNNDEEERQKVPNDANEISGEGSVESMLLVERGLRELTVLKIEDALAFAMAQQRWPNRCAGNIVDETKLPIKGQHIWEPYELSKQECDDVLFKQAWLIYLWRRVKIHGLEPDIVDERLEFWINQGHPPTSHDAVNVERGLVELRKLGIEGQLWQASRKLVDPDSEHKWQMHINF